MTHFGIICPALSGHLNSILPLGQELQQRGHRVTYVGVLDAQQKTLAAGLDFWAIAESEYPLGATTQFIDQQGKLSEFAALKYTLNWSKMSAKILLQEAPVAIEQAGVEALIVEQVSLAGGTVADSVGIPFINFCSTPPLNQEESVPPFVTPWRYNSDIWARLRNRVGYRILNRLGRPIWNAIAQYRRERTLPPYSHPNDAFSQLAQLSQQPAELEFPRQHLPKVFHFTGPYHNRASREYISFPFEKLTGQPLIYGSLGTLQNRLIQIFYIIAEACRELDAQLVISLGGGMSVESLLPLPGSPLVVRYAPQLELLQKAILTITHGGMNTTLESLSYGVPIVAIPITGDQPGVAARLAWTGTGEVVPLNRLSVSRLRAAIQQVLTKDSYRKNAMRLQEAIRRAGGVTQAANIIEQILTSYPLNR